MMNYTHVMMRKATEETGDYKDRMEKTIKAIINRTSSEMKREQATLDD